MGAGGVGGGATCCSLIFAARLCLQAFGPLRPRLAFQPQNILVVCVCEPAGYSFYKENYGTSERLKESAHGQESKLHLPPTARRTSRPHALTAGGGSTPGPAGVDQHWFCFRTLSVNHMSGGQIPQRQHDASGRTKQPLDPVQRGLVLVRRAAMPSKT